MSDISSFINKVTEFTQAVGAIQGAVDTLAPAVQSVDYTINRIANTFSGVDTYNPGYYPPPYPVYPPVTLPEEGPGVVGTIGKAIAGGVVGWKMAPSMAESMKSLSTVGIGAGLKGMGINVLKSGGIGALVTGGVSTIQNVVKLAKGEQTGAGATGSIVADTVGGLVAGTGATLVGGLGTLALGALKVGGLPLTIAGVALGTVGAVGLGLLYDKSGAREGISSGIRKALGGY